MSLLNASCIAARTSPLRRKTQYFHRAIFGSCCRSLNVLSVVSPGESGCLADPNKDILVGSTRLARHSCLLTLWIWHHLLYIYLLLLLLLFPSFLLADACILLDTLKHLLFCLSPQSWLFQAHSSSFFLCLFLHSWSLASYSGIYWCYSKPVHPGQEHRKE